MLEPQETMSSQPIVTFGAVQVREFERIAGDHPDVPRGPPLSLGWGYVQKEDAPICNNSSSARNKLAPLNAETRRFLLSHIFDVPKQDIESSEELAEETRMQRKESYWVWKQHLEEEEEDDSDNKADTEFPAELVRRHSVMTPRPSSPKTKSGRNKRAFAGIFKGMRRSVMRRTQEAC